MQPALVRIGSTSRVKLTGTSAAAFVTVTGTVAFAPLASTKSVVAPSATGRTIPFSTIGDLRVRTRDGRGPRQIELPPIGSNAEHDDALVRAWPGQFHLGGIDDELPRHFGLRERGTAHRQNGRDSQRASEHGGSSGASRREKPMRKRAQVG